MSSKTPILTSTPSVNFREYQPASIKAFIASASTINLAMSVPGKPRPEEIQELKEIYERSRRNPQLILNALKYVQAMARSAVYKNDFDLSTRIADKDEVTIDLTTQEASCETTERGKGAKVETIQFGEGYCGAANTVSEVAFMASAHVSYKNGTAKPLQLQKDEILEKYSRLQMVMASTGIVEQAYVEEPGSLTRTEFAEKIAVAYDRASDETLAIAEEMLDVALPEHVLDACEPEARITEDENGEEKVVARPTTRYPMGPILVTRKKREDDYALEDRYYKVCSAYNSYMGGKTSNSREVARNAFDGIPLSGEFRKRLNVWHNILATGLGTSSKLYLHTKDPILAAFIQRNLSPESKAKSVVYYKGYQEMSDEEKAELRSKGGIAAVDYKDIDEDIPMVFVKEAAAFDPTGLNKAKKIAERALERFNKKYKKVLSTRKWVLQVPYYAVPSPYMISSEINSGLVLHGKGFEEHTPKYDWKESLDLIFNCMRASALYIFSRTSVIQLLNFFDGSNGLPLYDAFPMSFKINMRVKGVRGYEYEDIFGTLDPGTVERTLRRTKRTMAATTGTKKKKKDMPGSIPAIVRKRDNVKKGRRDLRKSDESPPLLVTRRKKKEPEDENKESDSSSSSDDEGGQSSEEAHPEPESDTDEKSEY